MLTPVVFMRFLMLGLMLSLLVCGCAPVAVSTNKSILEGPKLSNQGDSDAAVKFSQGIRENPRAGKSAEQERIEKEALEAELKRKKEEKEAQAEATKQRLLNGLSGYGSSSELSLKGIESGTDLHLKIGEDSMSDSSSGQSKESESGNVDRKKIMSEAYSKGFSAASECYSQNAGLSCRSVSSDQVDFCLTAYHAGFKAGDEDREQRMAEAFRLGKEDAERGDSANGPSNKLAYGECRVEWIESYNHGYVQAKGAKTRP